VAALSMEVQVRPVRPRRDPRPVATAIALAALVGIGLLASVAWPASEGPDSGGRFALAVPPVPAGSPTVAPTDPPRRTCTDPLGWRIVSVETWPRGFARVWRAATAVEASGPADPAIGRQRVAADRIVAIGWCAPVAGPDVAPADVTGELVRYVGPTQVPVSVAVRDLDPRAAAAGGSLWVPASAGAGEVSWPSGRYAIRLSTPGDGWVRWIGFRIQAPEDPLEESDTLDQRSPGSR
jgi:hypothetical protein